MKAARSGVDRVAPCARKTARPARASQVRHVDAKQRAEEKKRIRGGAWE